MKYGSGEIIKSARLKRGWDQARFSRELGGSVSQQAISRWESGTGRPKADMVPKIASALDTSLDELLEACGYMTASPVAPLTARLPFHALAPDRFEELCMDLFALEDPAAQIQREGTQGHEQGGIDFSRSKNGAVSLTAQCKQVARFGPAQVEQVVRRVKNPAPLNLLLLSRQASPEARRRMAQFAGWELLDADDLSRKIRYLPPDQAVRIVDTYFPGHRKAFLGHEPSPWRTRQEAYRHSKGSLFHHDWSYVGQGELIRKTIEFLQSDSEIGALYGPAGRGKSRLLKELAERAELEVGFQVVFLDSEQTVSPDQFELLPSTGKLLVVLENVHDRVDLAVVLNAIHLRHPSAKIVLSARPLGRSKIKSELRHSTLNFLTAASWDVEELSPTEALQLASQVWPERAHSIYLRQLASQTYDCPLITVLGAALGRDGRLDFGRLATEEEIRRAVLEEYAKSALEDELRGDSPVRRKLLTAIAALQPFPVKSDAFKVAAEQITGVPFHELMPHINWLEDAGILLRRGDTLRIVPDILGDVLLASACFDVVSGSSTGYIDHVFRELSRAEIAGKDIAQPLRHLSINVNRVDWQVRNGATQTNSPSDQLWDSLIDEFRSSGIMRRTNLLKFLPKIAPFRPDRALEVVEIAISEPVGPDEEDIEIVKRWGPEYVQYSDVLEELPKSLQAIAVSIDQLDEVLDVLWTLGQSDDRPTNPHPNHPLRVFGDIAAIQPGKPRQYQEKVLAFVERTLAAEVGDLEGQSPIQLLEPLLASEVMDHYSERGKLFMNTFGVNFEVMKDLRQRAMSVILLELQGSHPRRASKAIELLESSLNYPRSLFGRNVTDEEFDQWTEPFVKTLEALESIVASPTVDPVIKIAIRDRIEWHALYSRTATKEAANKVLRHYSKDLNSEVSQALHDGVGHRRFGRGESWEEGKQKWNQWINTLVQRSLSELRTPELLDLLRNRLLAQKKAFGNVGQPGYYIAKLVDADPSVGREIVRLILQDPSDPLVDVLHNALISLYQNSPAETLSLLRDFLKLGLVEIDRSVSFVLAHVNGPLSVDGEGVSLLWDLAGHSDVSVRCNILDALNWVGISDRTVTVEILASIKFADSNRVRDRFFMVSGQEGGLLEQFSDRQREVLYAGLLACESIDDHQIIDFLATEAQKHPEEVIGLLRKRIEHLEATDDRDYKPVPYIWHVPLSVQAEDRYAHLSELRKWLAQGPDGSWYRSHYGGALFAGLASEYDPEVLASLLAGLHPSSSEEEIRITAHLIGEGPLGLVLDHPDFVVKALHAAAAHGRKSLKYVREGLYHSATCGMKSTVAGKPFSEDVRLFEGASNLASLYTQGSIEHEFYKSLAASAKGMLEWQQVQDEKFLDGRNWD